MEFLAFSYTILRLKLRSFSASTARCATPQDLQNSSFSDGIPCIFLLHTEAQVKVIFIDSARCPASQDLQKNRTNRNVEQDVILRHTTEPAGYTGSNAFPVLHNTSIYIYTPISYSILRLKLRSFSAGPRRASPLRTSRILHFPLEFLAFSYSILRLKLRSFSASPRGASPLRTPRTLHCPMESLRFPTPY